MKNKFGKTIKRPHGVFLTAVYLLTLLFSALSIVLALNQDGLKTTLRICSYIVYAVAGTLLFYSVYTIIIYASAIKRFGKALLKKNTLAEKMLLSYGYRTTVFATISVGITLAIVIANVVSAIRYLIFWYAALAIYYLVLLIFRGAVLLAFANLRRKSSIPTRIKHINEWKIYLFVGAFLIVLELSMAIVIALQIRGDRPVQSSEIMAITTATYAFYKMGMSIYNIFRARKFQLPAVQAIRNINFADACMSIFSLTVLLLSTFGGEGDADFIVIVTAITCLAAVLSVASVMIVRANKNIKRLLG